MKNERLNFTDFCGFSYMLTVSELLFRCCQGWSGGARCWVDFQYRDVLLIWIIVGQGLTALAVGAGEGCLDIFFSRLSFLFFLPLFGRRPDKD